MKNLRRLVSDSVIVAFVALACSRALDSRAQTGGLDLSQLQLVASNAIPSFANFYFAQNYGLIPRATGISSFGPPLPFDPRPDLPLYSLNDGNHDYIIDDYGVDYSAQAQPAGMAMRAGGMMAMDAGEMLPQFTFPQDSLWLQITNVINGLAYVDLNNATDVVYEILTTTDLNTNWTIEEEVWSTNQTVMPFTIPQNGRTNLFVWAMDWTGVTENGNTTPDWWFWENFGTTALSDTNLDGQGNTLLSDYENGVNPNLIAFTLGLTNQYVNTTVTPMTIGVTQGVPFYGAVLVDDTNLGDAVWTPYASSNLSVTLGGAGWRGVWVGLRGHATDSQQVWTYVGMDYVPFLPGLFVTNPAVTTTVQPMIQLQGYSPVPLASLTYDLNNAAGLVTNQSGFVTDQYYDSNVFEFTTNYFQCYDIGLAAGTNLITLHGTDIAGNVTATNFTMVVNPGTNAPVITLNFPQNGMNVCGSNFTVDGWLDNPTAGITLTMVDTNGCTNSYGGEVERSGRFWVENLPLTARTNNLMLTATDVWGNSAVTNLSIVQSSLALTVNTFDSNQLFQPTINLSGTISDAGARISVNGASAVNNGDGTWLASNVPTTDNGGGTVSFSFAMTDSQGSAVAMTADDDKPDLVYVDSYSVNVSTQIHTRQDAYDNLYPGFGLPFDYSTEMWNTNTGSFDWQNGSTGKGSAALDVTVQYEPQAMGYTDVCSSTMSWPVMYWTNLLPGTYTGTGPCDGYGIPGYGPVPAPVITWEHADVTVSSNSGYYMPYYNEDPLSGEIAWETETDQLNYKRGAQTSIKYYSGGKAIPARENLIQFSASAWQMTNLTDQPPYAWYGNSPVDGVAIPPTEITLGSEGQLGTDGILYKVVADGTTADITPRAPQTYNFYPFTDSALKHQLQIVANGIALSNDVVVNGANFLVGQFVAFALAGVPSDVVATNFHWSFGGDYFNAQSNAVAGVSFPTCSLNPYKNQSLLSAPVSTNFWVSGGVTSPNKYSATLDLTLVPTNGNPAQSCTVQGSFYMLRPLPAFYVQIRDQVRVDSNQWVNGSPSGTSRLYFGMNHNPSDAGIAFGYTNAPVAPLSPNTYGQYFVTQVIDSFTVEYNLVSGGNCSGYETNDTLGLDTQYPYGGISSGSLNFEWTDSPGQQLSVALWLYEANSFSTYLMFQPNVGGNSVAVPMYKTEWNWYGSATNNPWGLKSGSASASPSSVTEQFPKWTHIIAGLNTMPQYMIQTNCFPEN